MTYPFTFHLQVKPGIYSQNEVSKYRNFFSDETVNNSLQNYGKVHFGRTVLIPNERVVPGSHGTFAFQVIMVYDDELEDLIRLFWDTPAFRNMFTKISIVAKKSYDTPQTFEQFRAFILENNINHSARELHKGYKLSVKSIWKAFGQPGVVAG
jgi:hypothetical protein